MERNIRDSQNFLHNVHLVNKLVGMSNICRDDLVYEIGPGKGIITRALKGHCKQIVAIEYDAELFKKLQEQFQGQLDITILHRDFLTVDLPSEPYKIFSNIPFNMTADILSKLLTTGKTPEDMYLVMQREAVYKYAGEPLCQDSFKSLLFKPIYEISIIHEFDKTDFTPSPNVSIVFVHFHKKEYCDIKKVPLIEYWDFLAYVYSAPGKFFKEKTKKIFSYEQQKRLKKQLDIEDEAFISEWTYRQWLGLFEVYSKMVTAPDKRQLVIGAYNRLLAEQAKIEKLHRNRNNKY
ncbi:TPA: 23S ribosomal RNA methyltransferase Erm [Enterobacter hormaechei subsp. xiangfangensis]